MSQASCPSPEQLSGYVLGRLADADLEQIAAHAAHCDACQQRLAMMDSDSDALVASVRRARSEPTREEPQLVPCLLRAEALIGGPPPVPLEPAAPQRIGPYRVHRLLGAGGMGQVWEAQDTQLDRRVAIKVLSPALAGNAVARQRFLCEARAMAAVTDEHIVRIYTVGETDEGLPYLAMELLQGESLEQRLRRTGNAPGRPSLPLAEALRIAAEAALGLAAAHARGLIHRDVKPANLWLLAGTDRVKLLDFGLALAEHQDLRLTQTGNVLGTPAYMAPEQASGRAVDARADLFSLGCILYLMTTGAVTFGRGTAFETLWAVTQEEPRSPGELNPRLPAGVAALIQTLLAKDPKGRPAGAAAVAATLAALRHPPQRRWMLAASLAVVGAAALLVGILTLVLRHEGPAPTTSTAVVPPPTPGPAQILRRRGPIDETFRHGVAALPPHRQAWVVAGKLREYNPGFHGEVFHLLDEQKEYVRRLDVTTDFVTDLNPIRALSRLEVLRCIGSAPGRGSLVDLRPLRGLPLTQLRCQNNRITDLTPLLDLPLVVLWCDFDRRRDAAVLRKIRTLKRINGQPADAVLSAGGR